MLYAIIIICRVIINIKIKVKIRLVLWNRRHHPINHHIIKIINKIVSDTVTQIILI